MSPVWWVVCRKELRETLRDRRTLLTMIVVPVLLYPGLLVVSEQMLLFGMRSLEREPAPVAVVGEVPDVLADLLEGASDLVVVPLAGDPAAAIREERVAAAAILGEGGGPEGTRGVTLLYDGASDRSQRARGELARVLDGWRDTLVAARTRARGLPPTFAAPVSVADSSIARPAELGGYTLGRILPLLLVVVTLLGAFYPAIDLAAGEKERGTLETLLSAPVPAGAVVAGKFVAVALTGLVAAALNLGSMLLTFQTGMLQLTESVGLEVSLPLSAVLLIFAALLPLSVLFGALFLGIAVRSSSFKEAQNALTPVYMLVLVPAMLPIFPGIDFGPLLALVPVAGVAFLFRDLMTGDARPLLGALALLSTALYAWIALLFAARAFGNENVLFGDARDEPGRWDEPGTEGEPAGDVGASPEGEARAVPTPGAAVLFVAFVAVVFFYGGVTLQIRLGEAGLLAAEWLLLFAPAVLFVWLGRYDARRTLSLAPAPAAAYAAGALIVAGALPLVWLVGWLQTFVLPVPWELLEGLEELVRADSLRRLAWLLLLLAVTPAVCEEVVFRGVLLGATRTTSPSWRFVALNGVVFGAFHLSFETVIRFLPTACLGALIAWVVWRTGSILVGMLMHLLNNAVIVALASSPALREALSDPEAPPPLWLIPLGLLAFTLGARVLRAAAPPPTGPGGRGPPVPRSTPPTERPS